MIEREFLGWQRPFVDECIDWLLTHRDTLPQMLIVIPTAQSGRRLRESLAERAGAILSPKFVTPGSFLHVNDSAAPPDWIEQVAWIETLESIENWSDYTGIFPIAPAEDNAGTIGLAREMVALRRTLQENGLLISTAARKLEEIADDERWENLTRLENLVEGKLQSWGIKSRSRILADGIPISSSFLHMVLAGVAEIPPLLESALSTWQGKVSVLIGAPFSEAHHFSPMGRPLASWLDLPLVWPSGSVKVLATSQQQAEEALRIVIEAKLPSDRIALGAADTQVGDALARTFTNQGWTAFHPASQPLKTGLCRWLIGFQKWLVDPALLTVADLLGFPETAAIIPGKLIEHSKTLADLRNRWMITTAEELHRKIAEHSFRDEVTKKSANDLSEAIGILSQLRNRLRSKNFSLELKTIFTKLTRTNENAQGITDWMTEWLEQAKPIIHQLDRDPGFWIELMISELPSSPPIPLDGKVLDVQGWLELFHEPGPHLILCGMNDGKVPARSGGEPWLSESSRNRLGLITDSDKAARDSYLYQSMLQSRLTNGSTHILCGKVGTSGEPMLPSRLLLAGNRDDLAKRTTILFKENEPPPLFHYNDKIWQWQLRDKAPPAKINITSLKDYLTCPFRYELKHVFTMQTPEPNRSEWNARDFGNIAHTVLERWGSDKFAKNSDNPNVIRKWLTNELERVVTEAFGQHLPLAVRIQKAALEQRLEWFSQAQAMIKKEGWEIEKIEEKVEIIINDVTLVGKIDRIDFHPTTGQRRIIDYKTGKIENTNKKIRKKLINKTFIANHLIDSPAIYSAEIESKLTDFLWLDLQLPLYASTLDHLEKSMPTLCYFSIGPTEEHVEIHECPDFTQHDLRAAKSCAEWIVTQIKKKIFWPPAEKVDYDDYKILVTQNTLESSIDPCKHEEVSRLSESIV